VPQAVDSPQELLPQMRGWAGDGKNVVRRSFTLIAQELPLWSQILLDMLTVARLVKKFLAFNEIRNKVLLDTLTVAQLVKIFPAFDDIQNPILLPKSESHERSTFPAPLVSFRQTR
jgi:hypothetical protein